MRDEYTLPTTLLDIVKAARAAHSLAPAAQTSPEYPTLRRLELEFTAGGDTVHDIGLCMIIHDPYHGEDRGGSYSDE